MKVPNETDEFSDGADALPDEHVTREMLEEELCTTARPLAYQTPRPRRGVAVPWEVVTVYFAVGLGTFAWLLSITSWLRDMAAPAGIALGLSALGFVLGTVVSFRTDARIRVAPLW